MITGRLCLPIIGLHALWAPILSLTLLCGCIGKAEGELEQALLLAGENRIELEKALNRYAASMSDSLKYRATRFLIENMPGHYCYEGEALEKYAQYFRLLGEDEKTPRQILDSLCAVHGSFNTASLSLKFDIREIDSAFLCENIDRAFEVWTEKPWGKNVSFDDFCEYVLPYRTGNEALTNWRKSYRDEFASFAEGITAEDPVEAAIALRNNIVKEMHPKRFTMTSPAGYPNLDAFTAKHLTGSCDNINQFVLFLFRANGIPCATDYMPARSRVNSGHSWVSLKNSNGEYFTIDYMGEVTYITDSTLNRRTSKPKVYRKTFSRNAGRFVRLDEKSNSIPREFSMHNYRFHDVTELYSNYLTDLSVPEDLIYEDAPRSSTVFYLCTVSGMNWIPADWTDMRQAGYITFENIEAGNIFRVAVHEDGRLVFVTDPFKLHHQHYRIEVLEKHDKNGCEPLVLYSKYPLDGETHFRSRMVGGVFEGSNNPNFENPDTLHIIRDMPFRLCQRAAVPSPNRHRYVRYKGPKGGHCNIAEVEFLSNSIVLRGKIIGTPGSERNDGTHELARIFDGSTATSFHHHTPNEGWAGLDLGTPQRITEIIYSPRNQDNYIKKGDRYELFISNGQGWKSLGIQIASSDSLRYENVPSRCLYYLKNLSGGIQERPFTMENGKAVFF